jgi:hypothetical protein
MIFFSLKVLCCIHKVFNFDKFCVKLDFSVAIETVLVLGVVLVYFKDELTDGQFELLLHSLWEVEADVILKGYNFRVRFFDAREVVKVFEEQSLPEF